MIIRKIKLVNFGIYGGEYEFDLVPVAEGHFSRPIILIVGKNGVGKTTLVEALKLCIHGSLILGDRVSQENYDHYLTDHIFKPLDINIDAPNTASIIVSFDFVRNAKLINYEITRSWNKKGPKVLKELTIFEDGKPIPDISLKEAENFLRELVSPAITDLFFFDGEKIRIFSEEGDNSSFLSGKIQALLGINLVKQLYKDIDVFITRHSGDNGFGGIQKKLANLYENLYESEKHLEEKQFKLSNIKAQILELKSRISSQEQAIASEGGGYSLHVSELKSERARLEIEIEFQRRKIQEFCNGLMPFAIAPEMCRKVASTLQQEQETIQALNTKKVLDEKIENLNSLLIGDEFWKAIDVNIPDLYRNIALNNIIDNLKSGLNIPEDKKGIIHDLSDQQRFNILDWIHDCLDSVPREFCIAIEQLNDLEDQLQRTIHNLSLVPTNETLAPLVEKMNTLNQELGQLFHKEALLLAEIQKSEFVVGQYHSQIRKNKEEITQHEKTNHRLSLAIKSQQALEEYSNALLAHKIKQIEKTVVKRFNELCRKDDLLSSIRIDPNSFEISLCKHSRPFERRHLSAGENQLLAISLMWALREVAGIPMPVIIDTPLSRLDNEHRQNMVNHFFPHASHQVILLATDAELTSPLLQDLASSISHAYIMEYDERIGKTLVEYRGGLGHEGEK